MGKLAEGLGVGGKITCYTDKVTYLVERQLSILEVVGSIPSRVISKTLKMVL